MIDRVIATALREALQQLPPRAFGLRSHAIPTEDHLPECLAALMALLTEPLFAGLRVVVGSSRAGSVQSDDPRITVLPPDAAAAEATRLRNDSAVGATVGFRLVYLNTESSAGEAGLDGLSELRAPAVVRHFALNAGLPVLADLAQSKARPVLHRLEDSTVDQLAIYADAAVHQGSELAALPLLGFLPRDHSRTHPSAAWATDFDSLSGEKLVSRLRDALRTLDAVAPETRPSVGERFDSRVLPPKWRENPFPHVLAACRAVYRFASGHVDALPDLCGLTSGLLRMFRRGVDVIPAEPTDDTGSDSASPLDTEGPSTRRPRLEEDVLQQEGPLHLRCDLESLDPAGRFLTVTDDSGETSQLRSREGAALMALLVQRLPPRFWSAGGSVHVSAPEALLTPIVPSTLQIEEMYVLADARAGVGGNLGTRLEEFLAARNTFVDALAAQAPREDSHVPAHDEDVPAPEGTPPSERRVDAVLLLDAFPLTAVAIAQPQAAAYVAAYEGLVAEAADAAPRLPEAFAVWLTNVDVAFHADRSTGTVVAARLLPTHPLRLAHALEWLRRGVRPPAFPPAIAVHYRRKDWLAPHGREFSFHNNLQAVGPTTDGLREAAREGLRALWMLLGPRSLGRAIEVELVDVTNPVEVLEVLCEELLESFQEDASVSAVHLSVGFAFSDQARQPDAVVPGRDDLMPLSADLLDAPPGVGVSLALARSARHSGSVACHLAIQAVDTPYVRLPIEQADIDLPGTQITYVPGPAGNIAVVKLTGHSTMDAYRRLLEQFHLPSWLGFAPIQQSADVGSALVRTLVSRQGWPSRLPLDDSFLSYSSDGAHVVVTLCDPQVLTALLHPRLAELSDRLDLEAETHTVATSAMGSGAGAVREAPLSVGTVFAPAENTEPGQGYGVALNLPAIREGVRAMFACRAFISRVLANTDARHLLGDLGLLRAFGAAREEHHAGAVLVISLDSPEGRAWAARAAQLVDGTETRADLLVIEADSSVTELRGLRIAELKARTTASELGPAAVGRLAHQAQLTAARVRACWTDVDSERRRTRTEALRRLVWMGAGHQLQALRWQSVLQQLDQALLSPTAPPINAECWIVPEDEWPPTTFSKQLAVVDELGTPLVEHEEVRFRILGYQALKPPHSSEDLSGQAPIETPKSAAASARRPEASVSAYEIGASSSSGDAPAASPPEMRPRTSHQSAVKQPQEAVPARAPASVGGPYDVAITLGIDRNTGAPATWRPYEITPRLSNQHLLIVGKSGSGKSETTKALVWELQARQIPTIIFDFQGEYGDATKDFYRLVRPQVFDAMAGLPINPFEVPLDPRTGSRRPFIESVFRLADTLNRVFRGSGDIQLGLLRDAIRACYGKRGFVQDDPSSWNSEPPTVDMLNDELGLMVPQRGAQVKNLLVRLQPMFESGIFRPGRASFRLEDLYRRTSVILMTSGISDLMLAASRLMLEAIYSSMLASGESARIRLMACIDEAHKLCGDETITALIKEARKYGLGLILSSQETRDFHPSVFANVGTLVCLQLEEADAAVMAKQIASHDASRQRSLKQAIMSQTFPDGIVRSNHFQPYAAVRLTPFHERVTASDDGSSQDVSSLAEAPEGAPSAAVPVVPTPSPEAFLNFDLVRPLKSGGMAEVYEARDRATGELVCIKRVRATPSVDADAIQREAQIYQKLQLIDSPYLLAVRSFERDGGYWALVTDYAAGGDLASYVRTEAGGRLKPAQAKAIALQVTTGLRALHETNIVHRDLKPENVLLNGDRWQIADFGIAKNLTRLVTMRTFQSSGTLGYMAPEQMDGSEAHPSADIYSLAKILVFMLTGGTDKDYVTHPGWRSLVFGCLDASPDARPTADGVLEELSRIRV